ncbi:MAG: DUF1491 family protein [Paracoccus sp. (in: a-proteobacteria)]|nr:DUF1491 family protein [Paracoccus sp. (in: a-proteobacteria)]
MADARLATGLWVSAYLARLGQAGLPAYVIARGDDIAGAVLVKCAHLDGQASLWSREWNPDTDERAWRKIEEGSEEQIDATLSRQRSRDPDLWVIEIESRDGQTLLSEPGLG